MEVKRGGGGGGGGGGGSSSSSSSSSSSMGGSAKSQKACRLKTSEAKFAKKPADHRDNVMMKVSKN